MKQSKKNQLSLVDAQTEFSSLEITPSASKKLTSFLELIVKNKDIYFSSRDSEGSEDSEASEGSEDSEGKEYSEGAQFFEDLLRVKPQADEWVPLMSFMGKVTSIISDQTRG